MWMQDAQYLLLLGANQFQRERSVFGALRAFGGPIVTTSPDPLAATNRLFSDYLKTSDTDPRACLAAVIAYEQATGRRPAAVVPVNDFVLNAGFAVSQHYGLPYHSAETIRDCREKDRIKLRLAANDVPVVPSRKFTSAAELHALAAEIGFPVVIKPLNFGGSGGVVRIDHPAEIAAKLGETAAHVKAYAGKYDASDSEFVVEPYIQSLREVSVEVFNYGGRHRALAVTDKFLSAEPHFSEIGHSIPSRLDNSAELHRLAERACAALAVDRGMAHVEIKITTRGPVVLEVGARPAGDGIMDLLERSLGQNFYEWHCQAYLGSWNEPVTWPEPRLTAALAYLHPAAGIVESLRQPSELEPRFVAHLVRVTNQAQLGRPVVDAKDWSTRYGYAEFSANLGEDLDLIERTQDLANALILTRKAGT